MRLAALVLLLVSGLWPAAHADPSPSPADSTAPDAAELARRIDLVAREIDDLRLGAVATPPTSQHGLGPAASKVYGVERGVSIGGYGEMLYENFEVERQDGRPSGRSDQIDFLRQIVYVGFKFDERFLLNTEIEFEHASTDKQGSVSVEFAYIDALLHPAANVRGGMLLMPMGFVNELHEPPVFLGARRPDVEQRLIPTTWRANGAGLFGEPAQGFSYRAYVIESLRAVRDDDDGIGGFSAAGVRGGRQSGSLSRIEDAAVVARADFGRSGITVGGSAFYGQTAQGDTTPAGQRFEATTTLYEAHLEARRYGVRFRALLAGVRVDDVAELNDANGLAGNRSIGSEMLGGYVEAGYELLSRLHPGSTLELVPYGRWEAYDTQRAVPAGFTRDPANDQEVWTVGAALFPHPQIVVKGDFQRRSNGADTGTNQWNVALGYLF